MEKRSDHPTSVPFRRPGVNYEVGHLLFKVRKMEEALKKIKADINKMKDVDYLYLAWDDILKIEEVCDEGLVE